MSGLHSPPPFSTMTMFDRLGDLISEALEAGELPKSSAEAESPPNARPQPASSTAYFHAESATSPKSAGADAAERLHDGEQPRDKTERPAPARKTRAIPAAVREAFKVMALPETASFDEAKKLYREKLMLYHPDRRNDNPVLQKVAKEKTEQLLKAWETIENWYKQSIERQD